MFCSGVPAASCRTTDERDGQQSRRPDKAHFCELTLNQIVFCRLLFWFFFLIFFFAWLTHFCVAVETMPQTMKERTRTLEDLYEELNYSTCQGTICNRTWRSHFEVHRFLNIFVDLFFSPPRGVWKMSGACHLNYRNHTGTQCTQCIACSIIWECYFVRTVHGIVNGTIRQNR